MSQYVYKLEIAKYNMVELKKMTRINSTIDSDLEKKFREVTFGKFGLRKGSIQEGLEEALNEWIKRQKKNERRRVWKNKKRDAPASILEHFNHARGSFEKNKEIFEKIGKPVSYATEEENALLTIITTLAKKHENSLDILFKDIEFAYVSIRVLQKRLKNLENTLEQQGIEIDRFSRYKDLFNYLDDYLKHPPKEDET